MKSFTDIEQSKKLVEILPIESADMFLALNGTIPVMSKYVDNEFVTADMDIPCWSLAALLNYLAKKDCFPEVTYTGTCYLMDVNFYDDEEGNTVHPIHFIRTEGESLVDVTIEMILKLHEEKLL
jgi:hypothetical protein